jgi:hypothetical protein
MQRLSFFWGGGEISPNFNLKIYDFDLCKGFFMENTAQIRQISTKKNSKIARVLFLGSQE